MQGRKVGSYQQTGRVLKLLEYLAGRKLGAPLAALAERFDVSERQCRRDLDVLRDVGHEVAIEVVDGRSHARLVEAATKNLSITRREQYTLLAVRRVFDVLEGTAFHEDVSSVYDKLCQTLPPKVLAELDTLAQKFVYLPDGGTKAYKAKAPVLDELMNGVLDRWRVKARYRNAQGKLSSFVLEPMGIVLYKNGLYVVGHREPRNELPSVFSVERFVSVETTKERFEAVPTALHQQFAGAFGIYLRKGDFKVVVDFDESVRYLLDAREYHATQKRQHLPGGGVRLSFQVVDLNQVASWVLSFGPKAKVVEPPELVTRVADEIRKMAACYERSTSTITPATGK